jgi:predicted AlkP superfamily phosphohydrolase/phosphomutase
VIIGVDGVDWDIMQAAIAAGRMPNIERMAGEGTSGVLHSIPPFISPSVWTTIATGKREEKHGIRSFLAGGDDGGPLAVPTSSNQRRARALWQIAGDRGLTVGFVSWLVTWPAEPVNGYMVSPLLERLAGRPENANAARPTDSRESAAYPPDLVRPLEDFVVQPEAVPDDAVARVLGTTRRLTDPQVVAREGDLRRYLASDLTTLAMARHLMGSVPTDLSGVYFRGVDLSCHTFWRYRSPEEWPGEITGSELETFAPVIDRYYTMADSFVGEIVRTAGDAVFVVCSDHGFRGHGAREGGADQHLGTSMHRESGIIVMAGPGVRRGATIEGASVLDVAPTVLAILGIPVGRDMDGRVLTEALTENALSDRPITFIGTHEREGAPGGGEPIASPVDDEIKEMLRSLGYIE